MERHISADPLAQYFIGHSYYRGFTDPGMGGQPVLDLEGADLLAAPVDDVLYPSCDGDVPESILPRLVPGFEETVCREDLAVFFLGLEISREDTGTLGDELSLD